MPDRKRTYRATGRHPEITITLSKPEQAKKGRGGVAGQGQVYGPATAYMFDDEALTPPRKFGLIFLDLTTRLRSVPEAGLWQGRNFRRYLAQDVPTANNPEHYFNEYAPIEFELAGHQYLDFDFAPPFSFVPDDPVNGWERLNRILLGSLAPPSGDPHEVRDPLDPTGVTAANGSGRLLTNCLPISYHVVEFGGGVNPLAARIFVGTHDYSIFDSTFPKDANEEVVVYFKRDPKPTDNDERWGYLEGYNEFDKGTLHLEDKRNKGGQIKFISGEYESFDTGDGVKFKVTREPLYTADPVDFKITGPDNRIHLRPIIIPYQFVHHYETTPLDVYSTWATRQGVIISAQLPDPDPLEGLGPSNNPSETAGYWKAKNSLLSNVSGIDGLPNYTARSIPFKVGLPRCPASALIAVITQNRTNYYVWRKVDKTTFYPFGDEL